MTSYLLSHLADHVLLRDLKVLVSQDRATTAALLAHLAEVDERKLYLPAAHPSMFSYCVHELRMSEDAAYKRIQAARAAREFPAIFAAIADGRLHLSAVIRLAPHLTRESADELLAAAANKTKAEIELLLAKRFPQPDLPTLVQATAASAASAPRAPERSAAAAEQLVPEPVASTMAPQSAERIEPPAPRAKVAPLSPGRFGLQLTISQATHDKLRYAQALLAHAVPMGEVADVFDRALDALIQQLERRKFAATTRSRPARRRHEAANARYIPAEIRRAVWQRDGGRCTFVSEQGKRCEAHARLEFDHSEPVACGGEGTVEKLRLRCRAHNQYAAECTFGAGFMREKRDEARGRAAWVKTEARGRRVPAPVASRA